MSNFKQIRQETGTDVQYVRPRQESHRTYGHMRPGFKPDGRRVAVPRNEPVHSDHLYEVEQVLAERKDDDGMHYYLKWRDCPESMNSWEPVHHLNCPDLLAEFHQCQLAAGNSTPRSSHPQLVSNEEREAAEERQRKINEFVAAKWSGKSLPVRVETVPAPSVLKPGRAQPKKKEAKKVNPAPAKKKAMSATHVVKKDSSKKKTTQPKLELPKIVVVDGIRECEMCTENVEGWTRFKIRSHLYQHVPLYCTICKAKFISGQPSSVVRHMKRCH